MASLSGSGTVANSSDRLSVLTVAPSAGVSSHFAGTIQDNLAGSSGMVSLVKDGGGTLVLSGSNRFTGGTIVEAGTLIVNNSSALPDGTTLTVSAGGTFIFDPSQTGGPVVGSAAAGSASAVPEPGTLALLVAAIVLGVGTAWRRMWRTRLWLRMPLPPSPRRSSRGR